MTRSRPRWPALILLAACIGFPCHAQPDGAGRAPSADAGGKARTAPTVPAALALALSAPAPATVDAAAVSRLAFVPDAGISRQEQDAIMRELAGQPDGGRALEPAIRSGRMMKQFDQLLRGYGYASDNLGDVLAAYLVIAWEIANDRDSTRQPAGQRAVRRQLAQPLASVPDVAKMSDARKQAQAERTAYMTMIWAAAYQGLKDGGDPAQLAALKASVRAKFRGTGVDLQRLELGPGGLVQR